MEPSDVPAGHIAASIDAVTHATGSGTENRPPQSSGFNPGFEALTGLLRDLELHRPLGLLLHDCRSGRHGFPGGHPEPATA